MARERLAAVEYGRTIRVAYREYLDNNVGATLTLLESTRPDLRGWEYHYVQSLCHTNLRTLRGHQKGVHSAVYNPDGTRVVTVSEDGTARVWDANSGDELLSTSFWCEIALVLGVW